MTLATPHVPAAWGEVFDKLSILAIKRARLADTAALANVEREHGLLAAAAAPALQQPNMPALLAELAAVNEALWEVEDAIRRHDAAGDFGAAFVSLARAVYRHNDSRATLKRRINLALGSAIVEEKCYAAAGRARPDR